jgi:recombination protein RecT
MSSMTTTNGSGKKDLRAIIEGDEFRARIGAVLPKHLSAERMAKIAAGALARTPKLAQCTPQSFLLCMLQLSQWGLEPDGRRAHLIPYGDQCTLIIDYKGIAELVIRSGMVATLHADVIRPGDLLEYSMGVLSNHVPHWLRTDAAKPATPGEPIGAFCRVVMKDGAQVCHVMSKAEIEKVKQASRSSGKSDSPWLKWPDEMWKKTVFKRASKWLPWSADIRDAIAADDANETTVEPAPRMATSELAGLLDAPEDVDEEPLAIEGDHAESTEAQSESAKKPPGDIKAATKAIARSGPDAQAIKAKYESLRDEFAWTDEEALKIEAMYHDQLAGAN